MTKRIRCLHRTLLFTAALAATTAPAFADNLQPGQVCEKKVASGSWHECGAAPSAGTISYTNTGTHDVVVFTTGPDGVSAHPIAGAAACLDDQNYDSSMLNCGSQKPGERGSVAMESGQRFYIGRADQQLTERTIAVTLD
jgi:hypothetical protein